MDAVGIISMPVCGGPSGEEIFESVRRRKPITFLVDKDKSLTSYKVEETKQLSCDTVVLYGVFELNSPETKFKMSVKYNITERSGEAIPHCAP